MARMVDCAKLKETLPGLEAAPFGGELGRRIYETISEAAWQQWLQHSTMIINELRLSPAQPEAKKLLREQLEAFLFGEGAERPPDYKPPT